MPECCGRWFNTDQAHEQHVNNSSAHRYQSEEPFQSYQSEIYECDICQRGFSSEISLHQHCSNSPDHPYCISCNRSFANFNNLMQHQHSRIHVGTSIQCPWCKILFPTASAATIHLESGSCGKSDLDRHKLNGMIQRMDRNNTITKPMLTMPDYDQPQATERAWNGYAYECYMCSREFSQLHGLNNHIRSPVHDQHLYHCPKLACRRPYKVLSGLIQHLESESCGVMRFSQVQNQARGGIQNMVGRMITN